MLDLIVASTIAASQLQDNVGRLARSINLDLALYGEEDRRQWGSQVQPKHLAAIKQAGFTAIRLPIYWTLFQDPKPPYRVDPSYFPRVNRVVDLALDQGLAVILDNHKDRQVGHLDAWLPGGAGVALIGVDLGRARKSNWKSWKIRNASQPVVPEPPTFPS
jgi:aryl-phospho-beta-D-glucosidase BglC (GH1 family)